MSWLKFQYLKFAEAFPRGKTPVKTNVPPFFDQNFHGTEVTHNCRKASFDGQQREYGNDVNFAQFVYFGSVGLCPYQPVT